MKNMASNCSWHLNLKRNKHLMLLGREMPNSNKGRPFLMYCNFECAAALLGHLKEC